MYSWTYQSFESNKHFKHGENNIDNIQDFI